MATGIEESGLDRTFFSLSSYAAEPLCWAWGLGYRMVTPLEAGKFGNAETKTFEVARRALIGLSAFATVAFFPAALLYTAAALGAVSKAFRYLALAFQKNGYTHVRGDAPEKRLERSEAKILTWNVCGIGGGLHFDHGGVNHWRDRVGEIAQRIKEEAPDVLLLQEIYDASFAEALVERLKGDYAHFFLHMGPNVWGGTGGEMVLSKCAVNRFTSTSFENNSWMLNRNFTVIDIKANPEAAESCARIIGTHLIHDDNQARLEQWAQIVNAVARENLALPTLIGGDLNLERDLPEQGGILAPYLIHAYRGAAPTCTNELVRQWKQTATAVPGETIDYLSLFRHQVYNGQLLPVVDQGIETRNTHLVPAFDATYNPDTALSDHHGVATTLKWQPAGG